MLKKVLVPVMLLFLIPFSALAVENENKETLWLAFQRGGFIMWVILALSVIGCAFAIERALALRRSVQIPQKLLADLRDALRSSGLEAGKALVHDNKCALARMMNSLLARNGATRRELEGVLEDEGARILFDLRLNLRPLGMVASLAPMLGLLGTVFGLIAAFKAAAELGMDDPRNFASGIYEALYTTAFGLVIAIPFLMAYNILRNRADRIIRDVEDKAVIFILRASRRTDKAANIQNQAENANINTNINDDAVNEPVA